MTIVTGFRMGNFELAMLKTLPSTFRGEEWSFDENICGKGFDRKWNMSMLVYTVQARNSASSTRIPDAGLTSEEFASSTAKLRSNKESWDALARCESGDQDAEPGRRRTEKSRRMTPFPRSCKNSQKTV